jgi:hypothetical protein
MCRKRESQFVPTSGARAPDPGASSAISYPESMDEELQLTAASTVSLDFVPKGEHIERQHLHPISIGDFPLFSFDFFPKRPKNPFRSLLLSPLLAEVPQFRIGNSLLVLPSDRFA